jgi:hypothetical protein
VASRDETATQSTSATLAPTSNPPTELPSTDRNTSTCTRTHLILAVVVICSICSTIIRVLGVVEKTLNLLGFFRSHPFLVNRLLSCSLALRCQAAGCRGVPARAISQNVRTRM